MDRILHYFPDLTTDQQKKFEALAPLYHEWNARVNLISRKDINNLYLHHVLHSLAIAKVLTFKPQAHILDIGTGGGFPGIPLAILFPQTQFDLIDGTLKKIKVVQDIAQQLGLENVRAWQARAETLKGRHYDFVVSRAVADLPQLFRWGARLLKHEQRHALPNGLLALKGGPVDKEIKQLPPGESAEKFPIRQFFDDPWFDEKYVVYVQG